MSGRTLRTHRYWKSSSPSAMAMSQVLLLIAFAITPVTSPPIAPPTNSTNLRYHIKDRVANSAGKR